MLSEISELSQHDPRFQHVENSFEEKRAMNKINYFKGSYRSFYYALTLSAVMLSSITAKGVSLHSGLSDYWEKTDSASQNLEEFEVVTERIKKEVISSSPLYSLSGEKMKTMGVTGISDALHRLPGVNIRDYGGAGGMKTVSVRGFGTTHTGVIYDGIVLSDCQSGTIDLSRYSLDNVGDLSLVIGDNSDIFVPAKSAAQAATISISTLSLPGLHDKTLHLTAQMRFGSFGTYNPYIRIGKTLSPHFSFSAIGEFTHAKNNYPFTLKNGILTTRERRNNSMMNSGHAELNTGWRINEASNLDAKLYYYDNDRELPGKVVLYNPESNEHLRERNFFGQLSYKNLSLQKVAFQALAKFNWDCSNYRDISGIYPGGILNEIYYQREAYVSGSVLYLPTDKLSFNYSADYIYNYLNTNVPPPDGPHRNSILQSLSGKFRNSRILLTARLLWSVYKNGVRKGESAADYNRLSPSLSFSVQPFRDRLLFLRASYKNIFRMPTFNESYYFHLGSTSLRPETTDQMNLGVTWQSNSQGLIESIVLTGDIYYNVIRDKIVVLPTNMFIWTMSNLDKARAFGADITFTGTARLNAAQKIIASANYSWQRVQPRTNRDDPDYNKQVAYTPVHSGAASISWVNPWVDVIINTTGVSERFGTNTNLPVSKIDGYMEFGSSLMRTFSFKGHSLELRLDITNIFNKQYEIVADYPMPGRAWRFTVSFKL